VAQELSRRRFERATTTRNYRCGYRNDRISMSCRRELLVLRLASPLTNNPNPDPAAVAAFVAQEGSAALTWNFEVRSLARLVLRGGSHLDVCCGVLELTHIDPTVGSG